MVYGVLSHVPSCKAYWEQRKVTLGITEGLDGTAQLAKIGTARAHMRAYASVRQMVEGMAGVERDDHALGDLAGEAYVQAQAEAHVLWRGVQDKPCHDILSVSGYFRRLTVVGEPH